MVPSLVILVPISTEINSSGKPERKGYAHVEKYWIPASAGMTFNMVWIYAVGYRRKNPGRRSQFRGHFDSAQ